MNMKDAMKIAAMTLAAAAIGQELAKPAAERTWHGRVAGFIPYDFRAPTPARLREAYWNPSDPRILTDRVCGVGWGVNFYWIWTWLRAARETLQRYCTEGPAGTQTSRG